MDEETLKYEKLQEEFRTLLKEYNEDKSDWEAESLLCKLIVNDLLFWTYYKEPDNEYEHEILKDENNDTFFKVSLTPNEFSSKNKEGYTLGAVNFDNLIQFLHYYNVNYIIINQTTDNFILTRKQLNNLQAQKKNHLTDELILFPKENTFIKPAYKIKDMDSNNHTITELYKRNNSQEQDNKNWDDFYDELIYNSTFYALVVPEENAEIDENGHPLVSIYRFLLRPHEEILDDMELYISSKDALYSATENDYVTILNFDDFINFLDEFNDLQQFSIYDGETAFTLSRDMIYALQSDKQRFEENKCAEEIIGEMSESEENNYFNIEAIRNYLKSIEKINKCWAMLEIKLLKNKTYKSYIITIKCDGTINEVEIQEEIRKILKNRCFELKFITDDKEIQKCEYKLIYDIQKNLT